MVEEMKDQNQGGQVQSQTRRIGQVSGDRWGDIYSNVTSKRMIALYDYDPQELSPNVDAEVSIFCYYLSNII